MGATLTLVAGQQGRTLARRLQAIRRKASKSHVEAGYIAGLSSPSSIHKAAESEFGSDVEFRPARPFMQQSVPLIKASISDASSVFESSDMDGFLVYAGNLMVEAIHDSIDSQQFHPLSPKTIAKKGNSTILIETHEMYDNAKSQIVEGAL